MSQFEFKFISPFPGRESFTYISFFALEEENLNFRILDSEKNNFIWETKFRTDYLAKVHFRRKQNLIFVLANENRNRFVRVSVAFHCVKCEEDESKQRALKGKTSDYYNFFNLPKSK